MPLDCIYSAGTDNFLFARFDDEVRPVKVTIGQSTDTHAQIVSGLNPGDEVLRLQVGQGRSLLERAGIKVAPSTRPSGKFAGKKPASPQAKTPAAAKVVEPAKTQSPANNGAASAQ